MPFGSGLEIEELSTGSIVTKCRPTVVRRYHRSKGFEMNYISLYMQRASGGTCFCLYQYWVLIEITLPKATWGQGNYGAYTNTYLR